MAFGERLRIARDKNNLTQKEVAQQLGIARSTYVHWEAGEREPNTEFIRKLADIYNVSADFLLNTNKYNPGAELNATELKMLNDFRRLDLIESGNETPQERLLRLFYSLNAEGQEKLIDYADDLSESGKYKKGRKASVAEKTS